LSAPAGAGKTTALVQLAAVSDLPVAWVQLDPADDDPIVLLTYLVLASASVARLDDHLLALLRSPLPPIEERVLPGLAAALQEAEPFLFVLDDGHTMVNPASWRIVRVLLDHLPAGAHIAVGTRPDPPLALARLRTEGRLTEVRVGELAFDQLLIPFLFCIRGLQLAQFGVYVRVHGGLAHLLSSLQEDLIGDQTAQHVQTVRGYGVVRGPFRRMRILGLVDLIQFGFGDGYAVHLRGDSRRGAPLTRHQRYGSESRQDNPKAFHAVPHCSG